MAESVTSGTGSISFRGAVHSDLGLQSDINQTVATPNNQVGCAQGVSVRRSTMSQRQPLSQLGNALGDETGVSHSTAASRLTSAGPRHGPHTCLRMSSR